MNWIALLLAVYVVLGFLRPGRMGSTYVVMVVAAAAVLAWAYTGLGR